MCVCSPICTPPEVSAGVGRVRQYEKEGADELSLLEDIPSVCDLAKPLAICSVNMNYEGFIIAFGKGSNPATSL